VVGLGYIAQNAVLPAFAHARSSCRLTALISGNKTKRRVLSKRYHVAETWSYDDYDDALRSDTFDAVYIALPNHLHREYAVAAAEAGKHVLCEKPMALSTEDCDAMIEAARDRDVRLMIAYRLHLDPANLFAVDLAQSGKLGQVHAFESVFATPVEDGNIRVRPEKGGGTLWDIGIYCVNACRYLFRAEPKEVFAWTSNVKSQKFDDVEGTTSAVLRFDDGRQGLFWSSFASADVASYTVLGSKGRVRIDNAYEYAEPAEVVVTRNDKTTTKKFSKHDQFAAELEYFADCVRRGAAPEPSGEEGRIDVGIIQALYQSARSGKPVRVKEAGPSRRPTSDMAKKKPPVRREPELVRAKPPHAG
jgi:glucose-fructose oxidoreductase